MLELFPILERRAGALSIGGVRGALANEHGTPLLV